MASALRAVPLPISHRRSSAFHPSPSIPSSRSLILRPRLSILIADFNARYRSSGGDSPSEFDGDHPSFDRAVSLFNGGDYHRCHDFLEELWNGAEEPIRTLLHGILQCAVGFHHLFNQNHRGAMMELGEGLCKLRKLEFENGPFSRFEREVSEVLEFLYRTQMELAACTDDICLTMDGSERSYQLLGSFASGQQLYSLHIGKDGVPYIIFFPGHYVTSDKASRVRLPTLHATEEHLKACEYKY